MISLRPSAAASSGRVRWMVGGKTAATGDRASAGASRSSISESYSEESCSVGSEANGRASSVSVGKGGCTKLTSQN
jgi:hypothetical protein